jgi:hypothetical protein
MPQNDVPNLVQRQIRGTGLRLDIATFSETSAVVLDRAVNLREWSSIVRASEALDLTYRLSGIEQHEFSLFCPGLPSGPSRRID